MQAFFRDDQQAIDQGLLEANGVIYRNLPLDEAGYQSHLDELARRRGYVTQDEVKLAPDTPNLEAILERFDPEHHHEDDEVRFVLDGAGVFDVRSDDERWVRIVVGPGDLIVVPKGKRHRFELTDLKRIHCVRLFKDPAGWAAIYASP